VRKKIRIGITSEVSKDAKKSKEENQNAEEPKKNKQKSTLRFAFMNIVWGRY
jgi:ribosomal protein S25